MRKNLFLALVFGIAFLAASCQKVAQQRPVFNTLTAGVEQHIDEEGGRTILRAPLGVRWVDTDQIKVFDGDGYGLVFSTSQTDVQRAEFRCPGYWEGTDPVMAVHAATNISECVPIDEGGVTKYKAYLLGNQNIFNNESYSKRASISMGQITESDGEFQIGTMYNMFSIIRFNLKSPNITSVKLEAKNIVADKAAALAGWVRLNYNNGSPTCLSSTDPSENLTSVTATASGSASVDGKFKPGRSYYFSVIPSRSTEELNLYLTVTNADGKRIKRTLTKGANGEPIRFVRNKCHQITTPLDYGVTGYYTPLTLDLDFTSWPFDEGCVAKANQDKTGESGETYTFPYTDTDDVERSCPFVIMNPKDGSYQDSGTSDASAIPCLRFNNTGGSIIVPAIEGRQLRTIELTCNNSSSKTFRLNTAPSLSSIYDIMDFGGSYPYTVSYTHGGLDYDTAYYIVFGGNNVQLTHMTLTYEKF